jgi:hypothetical protein
VRKSNDNDPKFRLRPRNPPIPKAKHVRDELVSHFPDGDELRTHVAGRAPTFKIVLSASATRPNMWRVIGMHMATICRGRPLHSNGRRPVSEPRLTGYKWLRHFGRGRPNSDRRLWRLILPPEFGERMGVAVAHFNTDPLHVHLVNASRGKTRTAASSAKGQVTAGPGVVFCAAALGEPGSFHRLER